MFHALTITGRMQMLLFVVGLSMLGACASPNPDATPAQKALNATTVSCKDIDAAIVAADVAIVSGTLKGSAATTTVRGLTQAQAGCVAAAGAIQAANAAASAASAASGVSQ